MELEREAVLAVEGVGLDLFAWVRVVDYSYFFKHSKMTRIVEDLKLNQLYINKTEKERDMGRKEGKMGEKGTLSVVFAAEIGTSRTSRVPLLTIFSNKISI